MGGPLAEGFQLKSLLERLDRGVDPIDAPATVAERARRHAAEVWGECGLSGSPGSLAHTVRTRVLPEYLCHVETEERDCFLVVVVSEDAVEVKGHLPLDVGAQYRPLLFEDLSTGLAGEPTEAWLDEAIPRLGDGGDTPVAIVGAARGTYMQTCLQKPGEYLLEYQTVTTAFHFAADRPVDEQTVLWAFRSYAFGRYEWARELEWVRHPL